MNLKLPLLVLLAACSGPAPAEIISLVCTAPNDPAEHKVVLDTEKRAVLQDGKPGNISLATAEAIHYFLVARGRAQANRFNPADDSLTMAIAKPAPDTGYERRQLACRRT